MMTTDEKIDEVLRVVLDESEKNEVRFARLEARDNELMELFREERVLNNSRFTQLSTGLMDVRKEMGEMRVEFTKKMSDLDAKIDRVHDSLSEDIQVFGEDLYQMKRRLTRLEKKSLS